MYRFLCNICDSPCQAEVLDRELPSCLKCGSNVRFRWIVHALSQAIYGQSLPLSKFKTKRAIRGLGLSDSLRIAKALSRRFSYTNTTFHREPHFDIMSPPPGAAYDFVIASEVFEHVRPPIQTAFDNLRGLLNPGGFAIFSSPYELEGPTVEHFPNLHDFALTELRSGYVLVNRTERGTLETFDRLDFHGGPGSVLEMRVFSREGLLANCANAGLEVTIAADSPEIGVVWEGWSHGMILRPKPL